MKKSFLLIFLTGTICSSVTMANPCKFSSEAEMAKAVNANISMFNYNLDPYGPNAIPNICKVETKIGDSYHTTDLSSQRINVYFGTVENQSRGPIVSFSGRVSYRCWEERLIENAGSLQVTCNEKNEVISVSGDLNWSGCMARDQEKLSFDTGARAQEPYMSTAKYHWAPYDFFPSFVRQACTVLP